MKFSDLLNSKKATLVSSYLGLYLISAGLSLLVFYLTSSQSGPISDIINRKARIDTSLPKTEECPINGQKFTKPERDIWNTRRPLTVVIENSADSRPTSGLSRADVVYEGVAEGGITRFLSVFYCGTIAETVKAAPIRSARIYFVNLAAGYGVNPVFLHQGGANDFCPNCPGGVKPRGQIHPTVNAYAALDKLGWRNGQKGNDMDGGFNVGFPVVVRDQYRLGGEAAAWEHSVVANLDEVYKEAAKRGFEFKDEDGVEWTKTFKEWQFQDDKPNSSATATTIKFNFWDSMAGYDVEWRYDSSTNSYKRWNGGKESRDLEFDKPQITAKNVVVMLVKETGPVDEEKHMFYQVIGTGEAIIFQNGEAIKGKWSKPTQLDREVFYDTNGKEIKLVRGQTWIELVPSQNEISY
jgi:hypothetical protein